MDTDFTLFDPEKHTSSDIPDAPGNYLICLKQGRKLPDIGIEYNAETFRGCQVVYTGISKKSLRQRDFRQHFTGNAGRSTLRKSLGSLFGYSKIPRDKDPDTGKTKFGADDEQSLSVWMESNLILYYRQDDSPEKHEDELIKKFNPPLNLSKNTNVKNLGYRKKLSALRNKK